MTGLVQALLERIGARVIALFEAWGRYVLVFLRGLLNLVRPPWRVRLIFKQMEFVGNQSLSIVLITGLFTGAVFALQSNVAFSMFGAQGMTGSTVGLAVTKELGPVLCALMVTGRAGSAMAAEIGTMRVSEQIDALEAMAVDPISYLVSPRLLAATIMLPILTAVFDAIAMVGCGYVGTQILHISPGSFYGRIEWYVDPDDIWKGLIKAAVFGVIFSVVGCTKGLYARGGAEGVGRATTEAVVVSSVAILIVDYFLTAWLMV